MPLSKECGKLPPKTSATTWASTYTITPEEFYQPTTVPAVQEIVKRAAAAGKRVRVVGSCHSPNSCAMSHDIMINLDKLANVLMVDRENQIVKVEGGMRLQDMHTALDAHALAMPNLGSISEQSIAGALSTGTHGTGMGLGIIATSVTELQLVLASGDVVSASSTQNADIFKAVLCSIGCLGIITAVTMRVNKAYDLHAKENPSTLATSLRNLDVDLKANPWYRFWWFPHTDATWEWRAQAVTPGEHRERVRPVQLGCCSFSLHSRVYLYALGWLRWLLFTGFGYHVLQAALFLGLLLPPLVPLVNNIWQRVLFSWKREVVDRSDRVFNFDCLFKQHVDEWAIPVENVERAMVALKQMVAAKGMHVHYPVEVRFVKGDDIWCSPAYGRDTAYIGIIMFKPYGFNVPFRAYFDEFERIMASLGGRPHWAKDFRFNAADMAHAYPMWKSFQRLTHLLDPHGVFCNEWAQRVVKGEDGQGGALQPWLTAKEGQALAEQVARYDRKAASGEQAGDFSSESDS